MQRPAVYDAAARQLARNVGPFLCCIVVANFVCVRVRCVCSRFPTTRRGAATRWPTIGAPRHHPRSTSRPFDVSPLPSPNPVRFINSNMSHRCARSHLRDAARRRAVRRISRPTALSRCSRATTPTCAAKCLPSRRAVSTRRCSQTPRPVSRAAAVATICAASTSVSLCSLVPSPTRSDFCLFWHICRMCSTCA